ncbi:hypothetical protein Q9233_005209 [Columba guinea]|nr:hypothetical protein Q9233_005209 [Columba guinea]
MAVLHCALCRRTSFAGRRHLYSAGHRRRLQEALARLQEEVAAARAAAAAGAVRPLEPAEDERRVWCLCCGRGVRRDGRSGGLALPGAALLRHMAGPEHRRATLRFWREQRAEAALRERVLVPAEECERLERALQRAVAAHRQREDERIQEMAAAIREAEQRQRETVRAALEVGEPDDCEDAEQPSPSGTQTGPDLTRMEPGQALTFIGHQEAEGKGNVHTGAKPPWLTEEEDGSRREIGPSYEEFLKQREKQKLKKLPAERVGANFDHTSETGTGWLPSFGRVWNHGRRWQSRHQFRTELGEKKKR